MQTKRKYLKHITKFLQFAIYSIVSEINCFKHFPCGVVSQNLIFLNLSMKQLFYTNFESLRLQSFNIKTRVTKGTLGIALQKRSGIQMPLEQKLEVQDIRII